MTRENNQAAAEPEIEKATEPRVGVVRTRENGRSTRTMVRNNNHFDLPFLQELLEKTADDQANERVR